MLRSLVLLFLLIGLAEASTRACQLKRCDHFCEGNTQVGYSCTCRSGFHLDIDGRTCLDDDECTDWKERHGCEYQCVHTDGSYKCVCFPGMEAFYDMAGKLNCEDVDECSTGRHDCDQTCVNDPGGYHCECDAGYLLIDGHRCTEDSVLMRGPPRDQPSKPATSPEEDRTGSEERNPPRTLVSTSKPGILGPRRPKGMEGHGKMDFDVPPRSMMVTSMSLSATAFGVVFLFTIIVTTILCKRRKRDKYNLGQAEMMEKGTPTGNRLQSVTNHIPQDDDMYMDLQMMEPRKPEKSNTEPMYSEQQ